MFCGWSQNFGAWGAVGRHTWWEWRRSVPSLCVLCYQSFQLRSHSIPWRLWFWQSPSVNGSMELFCSCRNLCVSILLESGGSEGVRVGLKGVAGSHGGDHVFVAWSPQWQQLPVVSGCYFFPFPKINGFCLLSLLFLGYFFPPTSVPVKE